MAQEAPSGASDNTVGDGYRWEKWVAQGRACPNLMGMRPQTYSD